MCNKMLTIILILVEIYITTWSNYICELLPVFLDLKLKQQLVMGYNKLVGSLLKSVKVS